MELFPIQDVTMEQIQAVVREALGPRVNADMLADFLASVVWSGLEVADPSVLALLGEMEMWDTEFAEKDITEAEYTARLRSVLTAPGVAV